MHWMRSIFSTSFSEILCWQSLRASTSSSNATTKVASKIAAPIDNAPQPLPKSATSLPVISPYWDWKNNYIKLIFN